MIDLRHPMLAVALIATVAGAAGLLPLLAGAALDAPVAFALSLALWALYTWATWAIIARVSRPRSRPRAARAAAFGWGAVVVAGVGTWASPAMGDLMAAWVDDAGWASALAAAVTEEPLKLAGVLAVVMFAAARARTVLDFMYYGAFVGLGFGILESMLYGVTSAGDTGETMLGPVLTLVLRGVVTGLWTHWTYTAVTAAGLAVALRSGRSWVVRAGALLGALAVAIAGHAFFDSPLLEGNVLVASIVKGLPILAVFLGIYLPARRRSQAVAAAADEEPDAVGPASR